MRKIAKDWLDKAVEQYLKKNPNIVSKAQKSSGFVADLKKEVEKLKQSILKYTSHASVINSIDIRKESDGTFTIFFDENNGAVYSSYFNNKAVDWDLGTYPTPWLYGRLGYPNAYMPLLRNEGYQVKKPGWRGFFGAGASGEAEQFVEKGVADYIASNGDKLNITVEKSFGSFINETAYY